MTSLLSTFHDHRSDKPQHATTAVPKKGGLEDVHVVYTGDNAADQRAVFTPSFLWHSDVCFFSSFARYIQPDQK